MIGVIKAYTTRVGSGPVPDRAVRRRRREALEGRRRGRRLDRPRPALRLVRRGRRPLLLAGQRPHRPVPHQARRAVVVGAGAGLRGVRRRRRPPRRDADDAVGVRPRQADLRVPSPAGGRTSPAAASSTTCPPTPRRTCGRSRRCPAPGSGASASAPVASRPSSSRPDPPGRGIPDVRASGLQTLTTQRPEARRTRPRMAIAIKQRTCRGQRTWRHDPSVRRTADRSIDPADARHPRAATPGRGGRRALLPVQPAELRPRLIWADEHWTLHNPGQTGAPRLGVAGVAGRTSTPSPTCRPTSAATFAGVLRPGRARGPRRGRRRPGARLPLGRRRRALPRLVRAATARPARHERPPC